MLVKCKLWTFLQISIKDGVFFQYFRTKLARMKKKSKCGWNEKEEQYNSEMVSSTHEERQSTSKMHRRSNVHHKRNEANNESELETFQNVPRHLFTELLISMICRILQSGTLSTKTICTRKKITWTICPVQGSKNGPELAEEELKRLGETPQQMWRHLA